MLQSQTEREKRWKEREKRGGRRERKEVDGEREEVEGEREGQQKRDRDRIQGQGDQGQEEVGEPHSGEDMEGYGARTVTVTCSIENKNWH